jgi:hypothetical protein
MVTGDYGSAANDTAGSCGGGGGRDQVYRLNVPDFQYVRVATAGAGSFATYVRTVCNLLGAEIGTPICDATLPGQVDLGLVSGDHYVWIDALGGGPSTYDVTATTLPPPNDVCPGTTVMAGLTRGTLIGGNNTNPAATCGGTGNDVFYTFTTAVDRHLVATVTAANAATNPVVSLRTTCTDVGTELDCSNVGAGASETLDIPTLPAGTYFLMVDSQGAASSFSLDLTLAAPVAANDTCSSPLAIAPPGIASTLRFAGDQEQGMAPACNDGGATDVIYSFTAAALQDLTLTITPTNFDASVYVRRGACRTGLQIGCADAGAVGGAETINVVDLAADTYYVIVEKKAGAAGESFDIGLTLGP